MVKKFKDSNFDSRINSIKDGINITRDFFFYKERSKSYNGWVSGSVSGSYFLSIYNRDPALPEASKLVSITFGMASSSVNYGTVGSNNNKEKKFIYEYYAKKLLGNKNSIFKIENREIKELIFINIYRNQYKDGITNDIIPHANIGQQAGSTLTMVTISTGSHQLATAAEKWLYYRGKKTIENFHGGPADQLELYQAGTSIWGTKGPAGYVFLQQGIIVLDPTSMSTGSLTLWSGSLNYDQLVKCNSGSSFEHCLDGIKSKLQILSFFGEVRRRSTIMSCVAETDDFNYSSNPTYVNENGLIRSISGSQENLSPITFLTTVGLYNDNYELLATAKLQKPIKKDPKTKVTIKVRLEY